MVGVTDVHTGVFSFYWDKRTNAITKSSYHLDAGASVALRLTQSLFDQQRLNSLRCFFCFGGGVKNDTFCQSGKLFTRCRKLFRIIGRGNLQIVFTPTTTWVGRVHTRRALTPGERRKKNCQKKGEGGTCDFPHYLDSSCRGSVDWKRRVCSQQEIQ